MTLSDRIKRHLTIENRILLPFLFISVTAVAVLFVGLYQFGGGRDDKVTSVFYEQRYVVLGGIALLIIIVETAVLVAYNIATPIRKLSDICSGVSISLFSGSHISAIATKKCPIG